MLVLSDRGAGGMRGGAFAADGWEAACCASVYVPSVGVMGAWHDGAHGCGFCSSAPVVAKAA